jgi:hypothetical protein
VRGNGSIPSRAWQFIEIAHYCAAVYDELDAFREEAGFGR